MLRLRGSSYGATPTATTRSLTGGILKGVPMDVTPLDLSRLKVYPLAQRRSLTRADDILLDPDADPLPLASRDADVVADCA
ncbi:MAG: hypothetical protein ACRC33_16655, partial [Gemmataceae bacterium]